MRPAGKETAYWRGLVNRTIKNDETAKTRTHLDRQRYPTVRSFERAFPALCFALATGVGKTRLLDAMYVLIPDDAITLSLTFCPQHLWITLWMTWD